MKLTPKQFSEQKVLILSSIIQSENTVENQPWSKINRSDFQRKNDPTGRGTFAVRLIFCQTDFTKIASSARLFQFCWIQCRQ